MHLAMCVFLCVAIFVAISVDERIFQVTCAADYTVVTYAHFISTASWCSGVVGKVVIMTW